MGHPKRRHARAEAFRDNVFDRRDRCSSRAAVGSSSRSTRGLSTRARTKLGGDVRRSSSGRPPSPGLVGNPSWAKSGDALSQSEKCSPTVSAHQPGSAAYRPPSGATAALEWTHDPRRRVRPGFVRIEVGNRPQATRFCRRRTARAQQRTRRARRKKTRLETDAVKIDDCEHEAH